MVGFFLFSEFKSVCAYALLFIGVYSIELLLIFEVIKALILIFLILKEII